MTSSFEIEHRLKYSYPSAIRGYWGSIVLALVLLFGGCGGFRQAGIKNAWIPRVSFALSFALLCYAGSCHRKATEDEKFLNRDRELSERKHAKIQAAHYFPEEIRLKQEEVAELPPAAIPEEDLATAMAKMTLNPKDAGSVLIACAKGTGKSNLLRAAMFSAWQLNQGRLEFNIFAGKDGETYCGLEKDNQRYIYSGSRFAMPSVFQRYERISRHCDRARGFPTIQISDEANNTNAAAKQAYECGDLGEVDGDGKSINVKYHKLIPASAYERVTKGRSKLVVDWMTSHSPYVEDLGLNTAIMESMEIIVLARGNKSAAISKVLSNRRQLIYDDAQREAIKAQWEYYHDPKDHNVVYALTNLMGDWRLVRLPRYPNEQPEIQSFNAPTVTVKEDVQDATQAAYSTVDVSSEEIQPEIPKECVSLLTWIEQKHGYEPVNKSAVSQGWHPNRKGMDATMFHKVLVKLEDLSYIEYDQSTPAKIKLLRLP